uniref:Developmental protein eyes absent (Trinotate prediction) n=1 Tax=Henneguya salminicola TaxID=69463 RepID=A0A6G3MJI6_HENSL
MGEYDKELCAKMGSIINFCQFVPNCEKNNNVIAPNSHICTRMLNCLRIISERPNHANYLLSPMDLSTTMAICSFTNVLNFISLENIYFEKYSKNLKCSLKKIKKSFGADTCVVFLSEESPTQDILSEMNLCYWRIKSINDINSLEHALIMSYM